ncbi:MAG: hypothetical protein JNK02_08860 [Planctomycetes bacterium]|nr:hypothetical protein [Planctomycetota bacterium]
MRRAAALALGLCALTAGGCGYSTGLRVADRIGSVGVTFFQNSTLERDVERPLQDALTASVRSLTDVPIADHGSAEVLLRGTILEYRRRGGIRSTDNELLETGLLLEAEAGLYDRRSDRPLGPQRRARVWVGYVLDDPSGEAQARDRAIRHVADELVLELFAGLE